jgi:hypothetical protein
MEMIMPARAAELLMARSGVGNLFRLHRAIVHLFD